MEDNQMRVSNGGFICRTLISLVEVELYCFSMSQIQQAHIVIKYTNRKHLCKNHQKIHFNDTHIIHKCCNNLILSESYPYSRQATWIS